MAAQRLETEWLQRWWCQKYNRPRKDPLLADYSLEELYIEFMEDVIEKEPMEAYPPDQEVAFRTDDPLINKWEKQIAAGEDPSIEDDFASNPEVSRWLSPSTVEEDLGFHDDYTKE